MLLRDLLFGSHALKRYLILSACLKEKGIESEIFIEAFEKDIASKIVNGGAGLVGFNCSEVYNYREAVVAFIMTLLIYSVYHENSMFKSIVG
ncbi:MAG: hypothetical protein GY797_17565 [Deltaproteobacteria bacterium]|nr:hypothetical protein [Deltaproteobacteria bacterium]